MRLTPHPGAEAITTFPASPASPEVALYAGSALRIGFFLGLPGSRTKFRSGLFAAVLSVCCYLATVWRLPDARPVYLLLAVTAAMLLVSLRTLVRVLLLLRQYRSGINP